ncbi:hypothetical protein COV11_02260 [Candidatus Woesearchaeota archaeon CG10_big_fil_rev_8_21_14_0_10_30_7]|nr:MAG: hypothetical protein COV11_02260 [Candidatus Woesearchaeota archaeon CG10_big_fil_rev_8_21_14_0_10_30_7]
MYNWRDVDKVTYGYTSEIERKIKPVIITSKELYPFDITLVTSEVRKYLQPTIHVDSNHPKIQELARNLAKDEEDLWKLVVKTALWVRKNVPYDLNTLTAEATQKASWVLENKKGVCDEITALFMALLRANNIPVKFVYGVSYTNNPLVPQNWGPHGWAEVYFPNHGWVPFDPTFDQYGWIDAGHVKLQESDDPEVKSIQVTWRGKDYQVNLGNINYKAHIKQSGNVYNSNVEIKPTVYLTQTGLDSMNLIIVNVKNKNNYYVATNLMLGRVNEFEIIEPRENFVALSPGEETQIYYTIKLKPGLDPKYTYQLPIIIYNEKNETVQTSFTANKQSTKLDYSDINKAKAILNEESIKPLSETIKLNCDAPKIIRKYENPTLTCNVSSDGTYYFENANVCLFQTCKEISFSTNEQTTFPLILKTGKHDLRITFRHEKASKSQTITVEKMDIPELILENIKNPKKVKANELFNLNFEITQKSYAPPKNLSVQIILPKKTQVMTIENFNQKIPLKAEINSDELRSGTNKLYLILEYDETSKKETIIIEKEGYGALEEIFYGIGNFFTSIINAFTEVFS